MKIALAFSPMNSKVLNQMQLSNYINTVRALSKNGKQKRVVEQGGRERERERILKNWNAFHVNRSIITHSITNVRQSVNTLRLTWQYHVAHLLRTLHLV